MMDMMYPNDVVGRRLVTEEGSAYREFDLRLPMVMVFPALT